MTTVKITIQKSTHDALQRLMRPELDDSVDDVIVSLLRNLERRMMRKQSGDAVQPTAPIQEPPPAFSPDLDEPLSGIAQAEQASAPVPADSVPQTTPQNTPSAFHGVMEAFALGPNEVMYSDLLDEFGVLQTHRYHSGMKVIVSPDHVSDVSVFTRTKPSVIRYCRQVNDQSEWVVVNVSEWKAAALEIARRAKGGGVSVSDQIVVFEGEKQLSLHDEIGVGASRNIAIRHIGPMLYLAEPESSAIDTNGMVGPHLLWLIIAIIQKDARTRHSRIVIEFEWKNSDHALFSGESGILKMLPLPETASDA